MDLTAWRLASELRDRIAQHVSAGAFRNAFSLADDLSRAAESIPNNIAEGFGRFGPREFRRFLEIARSSLGEVQNRLIEAKSRRLISENEFEVAVAIVAAYGGSNC